MSFLRLPLEVRLSIYHYVLLGSSVEVEIRFPKREGVPDRMLDLSRMNDGITRTCRRIRAESKQELLMHTSLNCKIVMNVITSPIMLSPPLSASKLQSIRHVTFTFSCLDWNWPFHNMKSLQCVRMHCHDHWNFLDFTNITVDEVKAWPPSEALKRMAEAVKKMHLEEPLPDLVCHEDRGFRIEWKEAPNIHLSDLEFLGGVSITFDWDTLAVIEDADETIRAIERMPKDED